MTYLKDFQERINRNDYPGFLKLWEEYCYIDVPNDDEFYKILNLAKGSTIEDAFGLHVEKGLTVWNLIKDQYYSHEILKLIFDIQKTNSETLASIALNFLEQKYPNDPLYIEKLRLIGLKQEKDFKGAISNYELLTHMAKGKFVFHKAGWGTCEILDVSIIREEVSLECDLVGGQKMLSFSNAFNTLVPLNDEHFLSKRFGNPDLLEEKAKKNPLEVINMLLRDLGPKTAYEIKEELFDLVIPEKDWNRWWQSVRSKLKKETKIEVPKTTKGLFVLRDKSFSFEKSFQSALEKKPGVNETIQMVYTFLRDFPETIKESAFKQSLNTKLKDVLADDNLSESQKMQLSFFLVDLDNPKEKENIKALIEKIEDFSAFIKQVEIIAFKKRILSEINKYRKDWESIYLNLLFSIELNMLKDYILNELRKSKNLTNLNEKLKHLIDHPVAYPDTLVWYFQKVFTQKKDIPFSDREGQAKLFENLLILLAKINERPGLKELGKKITNILINNRYSTVREILEKSTLNEAKEYILLSTKCNLLSDHDTKIFQSLAEVVHPSLSSFRKTSDEMPEEQIIWTTQDGYQKTQKRLSKIATVETVENAKEIEEARALGDLRENAEFKAALEKRDRLQSELKLLSDQLNIAKIIIPEDVITDEVSVGCRIECENADKKIITFCILGPWEADADKNILSFQSKLAKEMLGKKVNDEFLIQGIKYRIKKILNYFE
jgi:transcription elongation factor GreA-like protein/transcription elongation GreA/GreB family factor